MEQHHPCILALVSPLVDSQGHPLDRQALETAQDLFAEIGLAGGVEWMEGMMQQLNLSGGEE
jgi:transcriptional regulator of acetoin/glycerol metabolism